jgi:hypothetical protein
MVLGKIIVLIRMDEVEMRKSIERCTLTLFLHILQWQNLWKFIPSR